MTERATPITRTVLIWSHVAAGIVVMGIAFLVGWYFVECLLVGAVLIALGVAARWDRAWSRTALIVLHVALLAALSVGFLQFMNERSHFVGRPDGPSRGLAVDLKYTQLFFAALAIVPLSLFTFLQLLQIGRSSDESGRTDNKGPQDERENE